jgi:GNAT superfamily N-acetyltransferase
MTNITIRRAEIRDAEALPAIEQSAGETFRQIPELAWLADGDNIPAERHRKLIELGGCWVAVGPDDRPVGFVSAEALAGELHVWEFDVRRDLQGGGIGRRLIQHAIDDAQSRALSAVTLTTWRDVAWNEKFYAKLGFKTLSNHEANARLSDVLRGEVEQGFAAEKRCAMRPSLS